ncbi:MAG: hypothetical protein AB1633_03085 [Elusimicrobiota bacterium]
MKHKAIALYSGGLDSTLAVLLTLEQGFNVIAVNFITPFGCSPSDKSSCSNADDSIAAQFGFTLKYYPLGDDFIKVVKNPKYGYGRNMNPCIDCRVLMLKEAKKLMPQLGAEFIITGEVIGQRPMSQYREVMRKIDEEAGVEGKVFRPLCAKLLDTTDPEKNNIINREKFLALSGRRRNIQINIARRFGLLKIPQPAAGCLLTDAAYSDRLKDLLKHNADAGIQDITLLKTGRHFRITDNCKLIVGRRYEENVEIEKAALSLRGVRTADDEAISFLIIPADETPGPSSIICFQGRENEYATSLALSICARYSDGAPEGSVNLKVTGRETEKIVIVKPAEKSLIQKFRV